MTTNEILTLAISGASFLMAGIALGWTIYRDMTRDKPRVTVSFQTLHMFGVRGVRKAANYAALQLVNLGPGPVKLDGIMVRAGKERGFLYPHDPDGMSGEVTDEVNVGQRWNYFIPLDDDELLRKRPDKVGVKDTFGRVHWAPKKQVRKTLDDWAKLLEKNRAPEPAASP